MRGGPQPLLVFRAGPTDSLDGGNGRLELAKALEAFQADHDADQSPARRNKLAEDASDMVGDALQGGELMGQPAKETEKATAPFFFDRASSTASAIAARNNRA